jgi:DNA processing protein
MWVDFDDGKFPENLRRVRPRVKRLYYKGKWEVEIFVNCLAVVGSRRMTDYGRRVVEKTIPVVVNAGVTIVSGFMYGVDQEAHRVCVECGGRTIAVLGWGIERSVVDDEIKLHQAILNNRGLIVSEYEGETESQLWMFPYRNRIVAGLARAVLVVEAAEKSGSLVTADWAKKLSKKVLVVPGPITSSVSKGANGLIQNEEGVMVTSGEDVVRELNLSDGLQEEERSKERVKNPILIALENEAMEIDRLAKVLGKRVERLSVELSVLELEGEVERRGGKYYRKISR